MRYSHLLPASLLLFTLALAQTASQPVQTPAYRVGNGVSAPRATYAPDPVFPEEARKQRLEGKVVLWLIVGTDGTTRDVRVARSLGHGLDEAAVAAVQQWKFEPARKDGQPVAVQINVEVNFRLSNDSPSAGAASSPDRYQSQMLSFVGISLDLPAEWRLVKTVEPTYMQPVAAMLFSLAGTPAFLTLSRHIMEASPELYLKLLHGGASAQMQDYQVVSSASLQRDGWNGMRFTATAMKNDVKLRQTTEVFSRDKEHYLITIGAPAEIFSKHASEFDKLLNSAHIKGIAAAAGESSAPGQPAVPGASLTSSAEQAYEAGLQSFAKQDYAAAIRQFRDAVSESPAHPMAWNDLGRAYLRMHRYEDAVSALRKQIEIQPRHKFAHNNLGLVLQAEGHLDEAEAAFRQQITVNPEDRFAHGNLGLLLLRKKNYAAAVAELQAGLRFDPSNAAVAVALGRAYLRQGEKEKGVGVLQEAARGSSNPMVLNNVAYELAEHGSQLDRARQYAESALAIMTPLLQNLDLSRVTQADLRRVASLATFWDTLGWIRYKAGDPAAAEPYLRSAWLLSLSPIVGSHLGEVLEIMGHDNDAAVTYADALAAYERHPDSEADESGEISAARVHLQSIAGSSAAARARLASAAQTAGAPFTVAAPGPPGDADFLVLVGPGPKTEDSRFVSGTVELRSLEPKLKALSYPVSFPQPTTARIVLRVHAKCEPAQPCTATLYDSRRAAEMALPEAVSSAH